MKVSFLLASLTLTGASAFVSLPAPKLSTFRVPIANTEIQQALHSCVSPYKSGPRSGSRLAVSANELDDIAVLKDKYPREWAIFSSIDTDGSGIIDRVEIEVMCDQFGFKDLAEMVTGILDENGDGDITFQELLDAFDDLKALRTEARARSWSSCFGLGVAGNVAGHVAQAGEAAAGAGTRALPTGVFPFFVPRGSKERLREHRGSRASLLRKRTSTNSSERLETDLDSLERFPVTNHLIDYPDLYDGQKVQVEPEIALLCDVVYRSQSTESKTVEALLPRRVAAFNDCSIRELEGSKNLSERKNWGFASKGISLDSFALATPDEFAEAGPAARLALASYVKQDGAIHRYTETAPARNYLLFGAPLLDWVCDRLNRQERGGTWEDMPELLRAANYPSSMWIALGAGEYTEWGAANYIRPKDETVVVVFDEAVLGPGGPPMDMVEGIFDEIPYSSLDERKAMVYLHQTFVQQL